MKQSKSYTGWIALSSAVADAYSYWHRSRDDNDDNLKRLAHCLDLGTCGTGERTVVLLASFHYGEWHGPGLE
jgi:hypothetical protein